jgi:predicted nuclease with TOPRIM domain
MLAKKSPPHISSTQGHQEELENLYARRAKIDSLIRTLEEYDRLRTRWQETEKRKSA